MKSLLVSILFLCSHLAPAGIPEGYALHTVTLPKGAVTVLGVCSKDADTMAVVSWEGEVWEYHLKDETWSLFAENLMEPNGIYYDPADGCYYVAQKPELTRLVDRDQDGKCDVYENFTNRFGWTAEYHEYHYGPVVDSLGRKYASLNLAARGDFVVAGGKDAKGGGNMAYTAPYRGWVYRADRQGHFQPFASGFRSPAGIGMSPQDELFVTDNQGDWMPSCGLFHVREGLFYGHPASLPGRPDFTKEKVLSMTAKDFEKIRTLPAVWFPRGTISQSPGSPVWDTTKGKFGPFQDQIFVGDQTVSNLFRCGLEEIDGDYQGFCVNFLDQTESGTVKMNFDEQGRLWTAQVGRGWLSRGGKRTALQYAEWDGKTTPFEIHHVNLTKTGFKVTFTQPIGRKITPAVKSWHYLYHSIYGSDRIDEKGLPVSNYALSEDRKTVTFDVPLTPGKVYALAFADQKNTKGAVIGNDTAYYTLNKLIPPGKPARRRAHNPERVVSGGLLGSWARNDGRRPIPTVVAPLPADETHLPAPAKATVLDASQWTNPNWKFDEEGVMSRSKGNNTTKQAYGSARLHLEFMVDPSDDPEWRGQLWGNSGIFPMSHYELQVMNSHENPTCADGQCGALYGQAPPRVNASRPPGEWQSYDILVKEPTFADSGAVLEPVRITVFHNGILIHDDASFLAGVNKLYQKHGKLPLLIQDHKGTGVSFRNLWIVPDIDYDKSLPGFRNNFANSPTVLAKRPPAVEPSTILAAAASANRSSGTRLVANLDAGKKQTVVTYGTSLTAVGAWVDQLRVVLDQLYPGQAEVINSGGGGTNSDWGRKNFPERVIAKNPDTVFIEFSVNDAVARRNTSVEHCRDNLVHMIDRLEEVHPDCEIILMVMNVPVGHCISSRPELAAYNRTYREVANERGLQLIDHHPAWQKLLAEDPARFLNYVPDTIHPVRLGALNVSTPVMMEALGLEGGDPSASTDAPCWKYLLRLMDRDGDGDKTVTRDECDGYWTKLFGHHDTNKDGLLAPDELTPRVIFDYVDADSDGQVTLEEHLAIYRGQFTDLDRNQDGMITAADKR